MFPGRRDLHPVDRYCDRRALHVTTTGKAMMPVPVNEVAQLAVREWQATAADGPLLQNRWGSFVSIRWDSFG